MNWEQKYKSHIKLRKKIKIIYIVDRFDQIKGNLNIDQLSKSEGWI